MKPEMVIPKENAVFWLDKNGCWHNEHGKFKHKKIIDHFNRSIRRDDNGYYLCQEHTEFIEKVYFPYEDTALFAVDLIIGNPIRLILNTTAEVDLDPSALFIESDYVYMNHGQDRIQFSERALFKIAELMEEVEGEMLIIIDQKRFPITQK